MIKQLKEFCFKNGIKIERIYYLVNNKDYGFHGHLKLMLKGSTNPSNFFKYAFDWERTTEGYYYWHNINFMWGRDCTLYRIQSLLSNRKNT